MATLAPGTAFGEYRIVRELARGGMGVVYQATRIRTGQAIALKVIAPERAADPAYRDRFLREAEVLVGLQHPRIVPLIDWGDVDGTLYLALAYLDGPNLEQLIGREGPFSLSRTIDLLAPVAEGLDAAHRRGYIHRDVKPANVMLDHEGNVYLTDFGLGKLATSSGVSQTNSAIGTLAYMSPEQFTGRIADPSLASRTDIYALGCVFHACLTRLDVVPTDSFARAMHAHVNEPPPPLSSVRPSLPPPLDAVEARALAKDPAQRYATATEFIGAARAVLLAYPEPLDATVPVPPRPVDQQRIGAVPGQPGAGLPPPGVQTMVAGPPLAGTIVAEPPPWTEAAQPPSNGAAGSPVNRLAIGMVIAALAVVVLVAGVLIIGRGPGGSPIPSQVAVATSALSQQVTLRPPTPRPPTPRPPTPQPVTPPPQAGSPDDPVPVDGTWPTSAATTKSWLTADAGNACEPGTDDVIAGSSAEWWCPLNAAPLFTGTRISIAFYFYGTESDARRAYEALLVSQSVDYSAGGDCPAEGSENTWSTAEITRGRLYCTKADDQVQYVQTYYGMPIVSIFYRTDSTFDALVEAWRASFGSLIPDPGDDGPP